MRSFTKKILFIAMVIAVSQSVCLAVDYDIGQIVEISPDKKHIQVKDKIYQVTAVELLAVEGQPLPGTLHDLSEGSIVEVIRGDKEIDYWNATLVTVYQGEMEKILREKLELPTRDEVEQKSQPVSNTPVKLEKGVWQN